MLIKSKSQQIILLLTSLLILLFCSQTALAGNRQYNVEIILFEDANARYLHSEAWLNKTKSLGSSQGSSVKISNIKPYILHNEYAKMKASSRYNVLFYGAWKQRGLSKNQAFTINLSQLKNNSSTQSTNHINGKLKLVLSRFLHIYGQLKYQRGGASYSVNMQDRMRSRELHYIDHPLIGMLVQINPAK